MSEPTIAEVRATVLCEDCGTNRHHTEQQCFAIRQARAVLDALSDYKKACIIEEFNCVDSEFGEHELDRRITEAKRQVKLAESLGQP